MPKVYDLFPFFNELDVLEIRLHELAPVVDGFFICESGETYGGQQKPYILERHLNEPRFIQFKSMIHLLKLPKLFPPLVHTLHQNTPGVKGADIRTAGRNREAYQRDAMLGPFLERLRPAQDDIIIFSDCDEIPSRAAVEKVIPFVHNSGIFRFKQRSFYYNVNTLVDYGRDVCSRARIGEVRDASAVGGLMNFRKFKVNEAREIENGGWHLSYFSGDLTKIREKVAALSPFLSEYKLFDTAKDIAARKDLHRRPLGFSELPETYQFVDDDDLPSYYLANKEKFKHFTLAAFKERYKL